MADMKRTTGKASTKNPGQAAFKKPIVVAPIRPFLYTLDQISAMLSIDERELIAVYLFLDGRSVFPKARHHIVARNIAPSDVDPEWRVVESELIRWMEVLGFEYRPPGSIKV